MKISSDRQEGKHVFFFFDPVLSLYCSAFYEV